METKEKLLEIEEHSNYNYRSVETNYIILDVTKKDGTILSVKLTQTHISEDGGIDEHETSIDNEEEIKAALTEDEFDELQEYI